MKAAVCDRPGGPEVLRYAEVPDPLLSPTGVLVRVEAIGLEGGDRWHRSIAPADGTPRVIGYQCAGTVIAVGQGVTRFREGDRVVTVGLDGSHAELRAVEEAQCWLIPAGLSAVKAACVPIAFGTADDALHEYGALRPGEFALVHAGASGVGLAAIQLAVRAGGRVLTTASSDARLERLAPFGIAHGINYVQDDFVAEVRRLTAGHGADVVVNTLGSATLDGSLAVLADGGRCVTIRDQGDVALVDRSRLRERHQALIAYSMATELMLGPRIHGVVTSRLNEIASGRLRVVVDRTYPLREAAAAHAYVESRQAFGRVVLVP